MARATGRRIVFPGVNQVVLEPYEVNDPGPGEVLIETRATLISTGTDTANLLGRGYQRDKIYPHYPGYSSAGVVIAVGEGVTDFAVGDRVYSQTRHQSHTIVPANNPSLLKIGPNVSFHAAPYTTLYAVALYAVRRARIEIGEAVAILGAGIVGQLALQFVRMRGAFPVVMVDRIAERLRYAEEAGADRAFDVSKRPLAEAKALTPGGEGFHAVLDATGSPAAFPTALELARKAGRVALLGSPHGRAVIEDLFLQVDEKDLTIIGCHQPNNPKTATLTHPWSQREERRLILQMLDAGKLDASRLPVRVVSPEEAPEAFVRLGAREEKALSCLIEWSRGDGGR